MAYVEIHPDNPQPRLIAKVVKALENGALIAYPTDSGYALGCKMGNKEALDRIKKIRQLGDKHDFTLMLSAFAQIGKYVIVDNVAFRLIKRATPGPYTFILKGTKEVPRLMLNPKKSTLGVRIPQNTIVQEIITALGEPLVSASLILPGQEEPLVEGWQIDEVLGRQIDLTVDAPVSNTLPTTVISLADGEVEVIRQGSGDLAEIGIELDSDL